MIITTITEDIDFDNSRHVPFDALCLSRWPQYGNRLRSDPQTLTFITYRYQQALRKLRNQNSEYFASIRMAADGTFLVEDFPDEQTFLHFQHLIAGYRLQVSLIEDQMRRRQVVAELADALQNPTLMNQIFEEA